MYVYIICDKQYMVGRTLSLVMPKPLLNATELTAFIGRYTIPKIFTSSTEHTHAYTIGKLAVYTYILTYKFSLKVSTNFKTIKLRIIFTIILTQKNNIYIICFTKYNLVKNIIYKSIILIRFLFNHFHIVLYFGNIFFLMSEIYF